MNCHSQYSHSHSQKVPNCGGGGAVGGGRGGGGGGGGGGEGGCAAKWEPLERVARLASGSAVVIFSVSTCCMCHAVKRLFSGMGVSPAVYEIDQDPRGKDIEKALELVLGGKAAVPVVFIGGKLIGAMDRVMASHINGTLVPLLKEAGALWL